MSLQLTHARLAQGFPHLGATWQELCPIVVGPAQKGPQWLELPAIVTLQVKTETVRGG